LTTAVLDALQFTRPEQLVRWTYDDLSWNRIAELAPLAVREAVAGDAQAQRIVRQASLDLALAVEAVARRLGMENEGFPIVLAGGGLQPGYLADSLRTRFRRSLPMASIVIPSVEPAIGAALLATAHVNQEEPTSSS
jgi:N-acetylglucosamine kinase-like BadF-type ATPase